MDTLTFITEMVKAIIWPVTVLVILLVMRKPLLALFPLLQRIRFQGLEIDFSRQVQALAIEARQQLPQADGQTLNRMRNRWAELSVLSPRAVVLEAWLDIEQAAIAACRRHSLSLKSTDLRAPLLLGQAMEAAGILNENTSPIYHQLRNLRNAAAHASDLAFTPESAMEYADLALRLVEYLQKA